jgi:hypothetical protein
MMEAALAILRMIWNHKDIAAILVLSLVIGWYRYLADYRLEEANGARLARVVAEQRLQTAQQSFLAQMKAMDLTVEETNERSEFLQAQNKRIENQRGKDGDGPLAPVLRDTLDVMRGRAAALRLPPDRH